jgi:light-harvesting protein B-800-850 alpha chain
MIYGKIWLVVKPSVGIPLFLGSVAFTALAVHYAILTHTTWFSKYWEGKAAVTAQAAAPAPDTGAPVKK